MELNAAAQRDGSQARKQWTYPYFRFERVAKNLNRLVLFLSRSRFRFRFRFAVLFTPLELWGCVRCPRSGKHEWMPLDSGAASVLDAWCCCHAAARFPLGRSQALVLRRLSTERTHTDKQFLDALWKKGVNYSNISIYDNKVLWVMKYPVFGIRAEERILIILVSNIILQI